METKFTPTHKIIAEGGEALNGKEEILVQAFDGNEGGKILMTEGEFASESSSDWDIDEGGNLLWQGSIKYPYKHVEIVKL